MSTLTEEQTADDRAEPAGEDGRERDVAVAGAGVAVITGAGAGVGRAVADEFARHGYAIALLGREPTRLADAAAQLRTAHRVRTLAIPTDVADADAVEAAAQRAERELGPIAVWVNVAMATVFAPVASLSPREIERATQVTYLGQVYGTMAALSRMRARNRGTIVNVGSALAYRAVPLQSAYCGAKFAIRGFTASLRSELLHERCNVDVTMVDLPAVNTPQFDWAANRTGRRARPVPPVWQPEAAARAIWHAARHPRRQYWVGWPTVRAILANRLAPGLVDRYLAHAGYRAQLTDERLAADAPSQPPGNLFAPVAGPYGAHGRFDAEARHDAPWTTTGAPLAVSGVLALAGGLAWLGWRAWRLYRADTATRAIR
ncbi:MAG TPA: SDR family oxidoreductase [Paraburkholderia sp.]|jgi:short-subunit dehydrogenase|nr:SDR family oxidoreductase [Paraburkholderia sp.]